MNTDNYGVYGSEQKSFGGTSPVWKHIDPRGIEQSGGSFKPTVDFATDFPAGTLIPVGTPVGLPKSGGDLIILKSYELVNDILVGDTKVTLKKAGTALPLKQGNVLMYAPATVSTTGTGLNVGVVTTNADGNYEVAITADAWGHVAKAGDIFVEASAAGAGATIKVVPTGLLRREVYIGLGATAATGASVFHGEILVDRIPPIPACVKSVLPMIKFTGE